MRKKTERERVCEILKKLAFGKASDVLRLVFEDEETVRAILKDLDLTMLAGIKKGSSGTVEIKLVDRLEAAKRLMETVPECEDGKKPDQTDMLIRAIRAASENGGGENGGD